MSAPFANSLPAALIQRGFVDLSDAGQSLQSHAQSFRQGANLLDDFGAVELATLGSVMRLIRAQSGQVLIDEGEAGDWMLLVLSGTVDVTKRIMQIDATGQSTTALLEVSRLAVVRAGAALGEMSMLDNEPRNATCTAVDEVQAAILTRFAIGQLIAQHPAVGAKLLVKITQLLAQRLRNTSAQLVKWVVDSKQRASIKPQSLLCEVALTSVLIPNKIILLNYNFKRERVMSSFVCCFWWFLLGLLLGWLLNWLLNWLLSNWLRKDNDNDGAGGGSGKMNAAYNAPATPSAPTAPVRMAGVDIAAAAAAGFLIKGQDDIIIIEGIGPKIKELFNAAGFNTFDQVSKMSLAQMNDILEKGGPRFKLANPGSWAEQARLAANNEWAALKKLQDELYAGVAAAPDSNA